MRIAIVTDTFTPEINGVTTVLTRMVEAIRRARHEVIVLAPRYPDQVASRANGQLRVPSIPFPLYRAMRVASGIAFDPSTAACSLRLTGRTLSPIPYFDSASIRISVKPSRLGLDRPPRSGMWKPRTLRS